MFMKSVLPPVLSWVGLFNRNTARAEQAGQNPVDDCRTDLRLDVVADNRDALGTKLGLPFGRLAMNTGMQFTTPTPASSAHSM